jgi:nucleotide-binding universal stress UspA family protein
MQRIIVGYDGSQQAERALERAAELAQALAARLLVVSVAGSGSPDTVPALEPVEASVASLVPGPVATGAPTPLPVPEELRPDPQELAQRRLERARTSLARKQVEAEYVAEVGDAAERLLALANEGGCDLIVVGSRERGFLDRLLGRHVDEAVAAHAACDVLLVH